MNFDKAFDVYEEFFLRNRMHPYTETARCDEEGNERWLLKFICGFTVELTNKKNVENSAALRCWWVEDDIVEVDSYEAIFREFCYPT